MIICTCGDRFKTVNTGQAVVTTRGLFFCDVMRCPLCEKQVLDVADVPLAVGENIDEAAEDLSRRRITVYGR